MADVPGGAGPGYTTVEELLRARLAATIGGWRGALESAVPTIAFVVLWTARREILPAVLAAASACAVLALIRVVRRETLRFVAWAAAAVALAALIALRTGRAEDAFLPGMVQTAVFGLVMLVGNLIRWPLFGFLIAAGDSDLAAGSARVRAAKRGDRADPQAQAAAQADEDAVMDVLLGWRRHSGIVSVASRLGWVIVGLDAVRLLVMVPLYLAAQVPALGVAKVVLGWPAYLLAVLVMGMILVRGRTPLDAIPPRDQASARGGR